MYNYMSVYPSLSNQIAPGPEPYINFNDGIGNAGNGGQPNPPTIPPQFPGTFPRVNLNPTFKIGQYNNAEESYHYPRFDEHWKNRRNTNNPIGNYGISGMNLGVPGNAGNGHNKATAAKRPMPWTPFNPGDLGVRGGSSQSYPYNENASTVEGSLVLRNPLGFNINRGEPQRVGAGFPIFEIKGQLGGLPIELAAVKNEMYDRDPGGGRPIPKGNRLGGTGSNISRLILKDEDDRVASRVSDTLMTQRGTPPDPAFGT